MQPTITPSDKPWFLLQVRSNYEKKVVTAIKDAVTSNGLSKEIPNVMAPAEDVKDVKNGRTTTVSRLLYPSYVMVQMDFCDQFWHMIKKIPNVVRFMGDGKKPTAMRDHDVANIFQTMKASEVAPKQKLEYEAGQVVRIKDGPFTDFDGSINSVDYAKSRVKVDVTIFGRSTSVDLSVTQIEKV